MKHAWLIKCFAYTEIILGLTSLFFIVFRLFNHPSSYPPTVAVFLVSTALISLGLGIGILNHSLSAYHLLIFFSGTIILSKILILSNIISLNQTIASSVVPWLKNTVSVAYHSLLIFYFTRKPVIDVFSEANKKC